jgi:ABC-type transport system involved in multi-copper enzyme maturation permease subunit
MAAMLSLSLRLPWARRLLLASKLSWLDRMTVLLVVVGLAATAWYSRNFTLLQQVIAWGLVLSVLAVLSRRGWLKLFGPVLLYDLMRISRRSRYFLLRGVYACILFGLLYWQFLEWFQVRPIQLLTSNEVAFLSLQFFNKFMVLQFAVVFLLTPSYCAGAIAEEKDRKTMEYLLATDLHNREIVLSKLVSRLGNLTLTMLTGLPILSLIQFLGGVDPDLVLAGFAVTGLTMASLAALSILASVYARKPRNAILLTYLIVFGYLGIGYLGEAYVSSPAAATRMAMAATGGPVPWTFEDLIDLFNLGNLPVVLRQLEQTWTAGKALSTILPTMLRNYALFHGILAVVCTGWAVARVRAVALQQSANVRRRVAAGSRPPIRPRVGLQPMVWKELFIEPGFRLNWLGWIAVSLLVIVSMAPAFWIASEYFSETISIRSRYGAIGMPGTKVMLNGVWGDLGEQLNHWTRQVGAAVACLMLLAVAVRASTSISGERDRDTLDALLTSPLQSHDILFAKWLGSLLSVRWAWLWLWLIWGLSLLTGALHPLAVPLLIIAWLVYASTLAGIGLWFSTACRTSMRATFWTLTVSVAVSVGHWLIWMCFLPRAFAGGSWGYELGELFAIHSALTPPAVFAQLSATSAELGNNLNFDLKAIFACFGLFIWALGSLFLWTITRSRFRRISRRMPYRRRGPIALPTTGWGRLQDEEPWQEIGATVR